MTTARNRELAALVPVALLLTAGFAAVFAQEEARLGNLSLIYGAYFLALCLATHVFLRIRLPDADPYLFPLVALLTAFGLVMVYRIDADLARDQANWFVFGLLLFALTTRRRDAVTGHDLRSRADAASLVEEIEESQGIAK